MLHGPGAISGDCAACMEMNSVFSLLYRSLRLSRISGLEGKFASCKGRFLTLF